MQSVNTKVTASHRQYAGIVTHMGRILSWHAILALTALTVVFVIELTSMTTVGLACSPSACCIWWASARGGFDGTPIASVHKQTSQ
eukprot:COSAG06_NODE_4535_length_4168_cov_3.593512_1_plen_86_part_00